MAFELLVPQAQGFDPRFLADHFTRHGVDFDAQSAEEYEARAVSFLSAPLDYPTVVEGIDSAGDRCRFNTVTHEFGVVGPDGTVRTYHKLAGSRGKTPLQRFLDKCNR